MTVSKPENVTNMQALSIQNYWIVTNINKLFMKIHRFLIHVYVSSLETYSLGLDDKIETTYIKQKKINKDLNDNEFIK